MQRIPPPEKPLETHVRFRASLRARPLGDPHASGERSAVQRRRIAGAQCGERAAAPRVDGDAPSRRPAARRLPHAVPRLRARPRRPARVPVSRRRAAHRLERHRAPADAVRARVQRGSRSHRVVPARPQPVGRFRLAATCASARCRPISSRCSRASSRGTATASARSFYGDDVDTRDSRAQRVGGTCCTSCTGCSAAAARADRRTTDLDAFLRAAFPAIIRAARSCSSSRISSARRGWDRRRSRSSRSGTRCSPCGCTIRSRTSCPTSGLLVDAGRRDRRAALRRHARPRLPQALRRGGRARASERCAPRSVHAGVDALELSTDDDLVDAILRFADLRKRRSQLAAGAVLPAPSGVHAMTFLWPELLWLLRAGARSSSACTCACCGARSGSRVRYASLAMVRDAMGAGNRVPPPSSRRCCS